MIFMYLEKLMILPKIIVKKLILELNHNLLILILFNKIKTFKKILCCKALHK